MIQDPNEKVRFSDVRTDKRIHELLLNEHDEVTEQDINNIRTDVAAGELSPGPDEVPVPAPPVEEPDTKPAEEKRIKDDSDPAIGASWNILEGDN